MDRDALYRREWGAGCELPGPGIRAYAKEELSPAPRLPREQKKRPAGEGSFLGHARLGCEVGEVVHRGEQRGIAQDADNQASARAEFDGVGVERVGGDVVGDSNFGHESLRRVDRRAA